MWPVYHKLKLLERERGRDSRELERWLSTTCCRGEPKQRRINLRANCIIARLLSGAVLIPLYLMTCSL